MKFLLSLFIGLCTLQCFAISPDSTLISNRTKELDEVVVIASYLSREDDHISAIPTKEQRKHAISGYDLLQNLMIPGISVDRSNGSVMTPAGTATLYINGREVDFREVQSLRPKDIARVEYFDIPTGKYAKDAASINFITRPITNGGYTQIDALQGVGFLKGDYNLISKYMIGTKSLNLWAGYDINDPKTSSEKVESFNFPDNILFRNTSYSHAGNRRTNEYIQASISNRGKQYTWMLRGGMAWNKNQYNVENGVSNYWATDASINYNGDLNIKTINKTLRPSIYYYGHHTLSDKNYLEYVIDGYYARNDYNRLYQENNSNYNSVVKEDYYYTKVNANYSLSLEHRNQLSFSLYEFLRISDSNYLGSTIYTQDLRSSETILLADYSQRIEKFFYDINPGISYLTYQLKGFNSINHFTPRIQTRLAYMIKRGEQIQFSFALGNTYPQINTINNVEQQIDPIIILKGNPQMDNSTLLNPRLNYSLNYKKVAIQAGASYFYQNHAIVSDYYIRGGNLISTYRDDVMYHRPGIDLSITYKPSKKLNMNLTGKWNEQIAKGGVENRNLSSFSGQAILNYYIGDFSFGGMIGTPTKDLIGYQIKRKTYWRYQISALWTHGNLALEATANNIFLMKNFITDELSSTNYMFTLNDWDRNSNQFATLKAVYSFDYGKKTTKSPKYERTTTESAILK
ncbi:MAG: outer membrane beta-barrel family protein [Muribaculaceae bacterium]|nr:outer membrane beta-barrel family protein [Muribaculaceae bacterium]